MRIIAVDDEELALEGCINAIKKVEPSASINGFTSGKKAIQKADEIAPEVAFLDVEMGTDNGIDVAKKLQEKKIGQ